MAAANTTTASSSSDDQPFRLGESVIITGGDIHKMVTLKNDLAMKLGRVSRVNLASLVGQKNGIMYEVDEAKRVLVPYMGPTDQDTAEADASLTAPKDNRHLLDKSDAQAMTQDEIEAIKAAEGVKGLVGKLVESSATFQAKTAFSQAKYIRRKQKKYVVTFVVQRPTPDTMCELWCPTRRNETFPAMDTRWVRLRVDALAQLLALGNVHAASRVMVADRTNGFVPSAILSRLGDDGVLYNILHQNTHATMTNATNMGLEDVKRRWKCVRRAALMDPTIEQHPAEKQLREYTAPRPEEGGDAAEKDEAAAAAASEEGATAPARPPQPSQWYDGNEARALFAERPVDTLVVADDTPSLPQQVVELLPYVAMGGTIAVYCPYLELLSDLFRLLMDDCVCITMRDTWYREYQVLPGRCHPFVNMTHNGGYLLSAVRVQRRIEEADQGSVKRHRAE